MRVQSSRKVDDSIGTSPKKKQRSERDPCTEEGQVEDEPVVSNETGFGTGLGVGAEEGQAGIEPVVSNGAGVGTEEGQTELRVGTETEQMVGNDRENANNIRHGGPRRTGSRRSPSGRSQEQGAHQKKQSRRTQRRRWRQLQSCLWTRL